MAADPQVHFVVSDNNCHWWQGAYITGITPIVTQAWTHGYAPLSVQVDTSRLQCALLTVMAFCCMTQLLCSFWSNNAGSQEATICACRGRNVMLTPEQLHTLSQLAEQEI
jgi:hypothetical protein